MYLIGSSNAADDKRAIYRPHFDYRVREAVPIIYLIGSSEAADDKKAHLCAEL